MKIFERANLPDKIKYNGETYKFNPTISAGRNLNNTSLPLVIEAVKSTGKKAVIVKVQQTRLKGVRNLHGKYYTPSIFIFTNE